MMEEMEVMSVFLVNSGARFHIFSDLHLFSSIGKKEKTVPVKIVDVSSLTAIYDGTVDPLFRIDFGQ